MVDGSSRKRDRNIVIMAAVVAATAASSAIIGGIADRNYSVGQELLTKGGQDEQMLVLAMLAYDQGNTNTGNFLYTLVSNSDANGEYSKEDVISYYSDTIPVYYGASTLAFDEGDFYREISHVLIAISASVSGGIAAYAAITKSKEYPNVPVGT